MITLSTSGHEWRFACAQGEEHILVDALINLVERDDTSLEWSDAASVIRLLNDQPLTKPNSIEPHT